MINISCVCKRRGQLMNCLMISIGPLWKDCWLAFDTLELTWFLSLSVLVLCSFYFVIHCSNKFLFFKKNCFNSFLKLNICILLFLRSLHWQYGVVLSASDCKISEGMEILTKAWDLSLGLWWPYEWWNYLKWDALIIFSLYFGYWDHPTTAWVPAGSANNLR